MTMTERINDFKVISEEVMDGCKRAVLRNSKGVTVVCNIPFHTKEEEQKIIDDFCRAAIPIVRPDVDMSKVKYMEVVHDKPMYELHKADSTVSRDVL